MQPTNRYASLKTALGPLLLLALAPGLILVTGCVTKRKIYDSQGVLVDEQTIVKRPLKKFFKNVEME